MGKKFGYYDAETTVDRDSCGHDLLEHEGGCERCGCALNFTKAQARNAV